MKKFRIVLTLVLVLAMAMSLSLSAFAIFSWDVDPADLEEGAVFCNYNRNFTLIEKAEDGSVTIAINRDCSRMKLDDLDALANTWLSSTQREIFADGGSTAILSDELSEQYFGGGTHVCLTFPADCGIIFVTARTAPAAPAPAPAAPEPC